jgi:hypothetical protein
VNAPDRARRADRRRRFKAQTWRVVIALSALACAGGGCGGGKAATRIWPPAGGRAFSPYVDVTLAAPFDLEGVAADAGARSLTLAFVTSAPAGGGCTPAWGGATAIGARSVAGPAARLRAAGVGLRVSFGGASGAELARTCADTALLTGAYAGVLDSYHAVGADFDLEGATLADRAALVRRARAVAALQARGRRPLAVSVTVPVSAREGISSGGLAAVRAMLAARVRLSAVNLLAMDYGAREVRGRMGAATILATRAAHRQLVTLGAGLSEWGSLGVTVMVGVNDVAGEVLTLPDAQTLARFADRQGLGLRSIWSLARDNPCAGSRSAAVATCSGVSEPPYAFSRAFGAHPKSGVAPRRAVNAN